MNLNQVEPQTEIIAKAIADGVTTVAEYAVWLGGYIVATKECRKHVKESHDLSWLEPEWKPTSVTYNGEVVK